jgi:hypothetical protein
MLQDGRELPGHLSRTAFFFFSQQTTTYPKARADVPCILVSWSTINFVLTLYFRLSLSDTWPMLTQTSTSASNRLTGLAPLNIMIVSSSVVAVRLRRQRADLNSTSSRNRRCGNDGGRRRV